MSTTIPSVITTAVRRAAADDRITRDEAEELVKVAQSSGSKTPLDDVFQAIHQTNATRDAEATRVLCASLSQKLSRAEWIDYVQKCASASGVWAPSTDGTKKETRADLPAALQKAYDREKNAPFDETVEVYSFDVAGEKAYLMNVDTDDGVAVSLYDSSGKSLPMKADTENVQRSAHRIQAAHDKVFKAPSMKAWSKALDHTDVGVFTDLSRVADELTDGGLSAFVAKSEVKTSVGQMNNQVGTPVRMETYKNKTDGTVLVSVQKSDFSGPEELALFSGDGKLIERFEIPE